MINAATAIETSAGRQHLVRVGALGHVGRFTAVDAVRYPRHARVVVRTGRGLEVGEVLTPPGDPADDGSPDGSILRGLTVEDELLAARLERNRQAAFDACSARLNAINSPAVLMDVEHLFDGQTLLFYFLGEVTPELEAITQELAELYEAHVQFRRFAEAVETGCGPGCGTDAAPGCKTCVSGCAVAGACSTRAHTRN
jgi:cell fate regulator YaaT (PSP1 superfamily)